MFSEIFGSFKHFLAPLLRNKKPTFLTCNLEQVYAAILESSKNNDLYKNCQTYSRRILDISRNFFEMVSVRLQM